MAGPLAFYAPDPVQSTQLIPGGNTPASGAQLFIYLPGSSTKQNSYTDSSASTARTNPIVLDSGGNIPGNGEVWIASTAKFVLAPSNDTDPPASPYWTRDNLPGINNVASQIAASATGEWVQGSTATFVGVTAFSVAGDQTALYTLGRRVKVAVTGGDRYGIVTSAVLSGSTTSVGVTLDSSTLNAGLSNVQYGLLSTPNGSIPWTQITSNGLNLSAASVTTNVFVSGTVTTSALTVGTSSPAIFAQVVQRKTADESIGGATTTIQNDDHLFFPTPANAEWIVDYFINANDNAASTPTGMKVCVNVPAGATSAVEASIIAGPTVPTTTRINAYMSRTSSTNGIISFSTTDVMSNPSGSDYSLAIHAWILNGTTTGNIQLQWSPSASSGASTLKFYKGSHSVAYRVA